MMAVRLLTCYVVVALYPSTGVAQDGKLRVRYTGRGHAELWVQPKGARDFIRPELYATRTSDAFLEYQSGQRYWLVARDQHLRETPIGFVDISEKVRITPGLVLDLKMVFEMKTATKTYASGGWLWRRRRVWTEQQDYRVSRLVYSWTDTESPEYLENQRLQE